jgi:hypothetical protein
MRPVIGGGRIHAALDIEQFDAPELDRVALALQ